MEPSEANSLDHLIVKAVDGDRTALETVLLQFHDPLLRYIQSSLGSARSDGISAEDVLQEVLVEVFRGIRKFKPNGSEAFNAWLKTIARSRVANAVKSRHALKRGGGRQILAGPVPAENGSTAKSVLGLIAGSGPTASAIARRRETLEAVSKAISELAPEKRQVLDLRFGREMSVAQIAEAVGKTESAVKMILSRAMKELRERVEDLGEFSIGG